MEKPPENADLSTSGVLVIDKPVGMTSHDVVQVVRQGTHIRRVGHTGTLDPRASGVMVLLLGPAVRLSEYITASDKSYHAVLELGVNTDTYDGEGKVTRRRSAEHITDAMFDEALQSFVGEIDQVPPPYSAIKVEGKRAYDLARKGKEVELAARKIRVYSLELLEWAPPEAVIDVSCSSGTYIRSLAQDLGEKLGCGAHLIGLRRTSSGHFTLRDAVPLSKLREDFEDGTWHLHLIPPAEALADWPALELSEEEVELLRHGHAIPAGEVPASQVRGLSVDGDLIALLEFIADEQIWQPRKVFYSQQTR